MQELFQFKKVILTILGSINLILNNKRVFLNKIVNLFINGLKEGNFLRFVNDYE